jgi:hypothetical protein
MQLTPRIRSLIDKYCPEMRDLTLPPFPAQPDS